MGRWIFLFGSWKVDLSFDIEVELGQRMSNNMTQINDETI